MKIGFIGLGNVGGKLAGTLLRNGHALVVRDLNPLLVFLAVWFGGWLWGIAGIVIAVPTLVALKVAAEHRRAGHALVAFLGPAGSARRSTTRRRAQSGSEMTA